MASISCNPTASESHPESLDFLSRTWCDFAVQTLQSDHHQLNDQSIILPDHSLPLENFDQSINLMEKSTKLDDAADFQSIPPWKSNDVKSWIWMQQAMHPELNYNSLFRKKWKLSWKMVPFKKWVKEMKLRRKEEKRLKRAQVHAAISVAGVAAALAAIAAENTRKDESRTSTDVAIASAAALVAAQCAKAAEAMGCNKEQLNSAIGSALCGTSASDIITLTTAATTSLRGAQTLEARSGCKKLLDSSSASILILPIEDKNNFPIDLDKCRSVLAKGTQLGVQTLDGKYKVRLVSIALDRDGKVLVKVRKLNLFKTKKQSLILDLHAELYRDSEAAEDDDSDTCYMLVLTTNLGTIKLDMGDDYQRYNTWAATIHHMLRVSTSFTKYQLEFYPN